MGNLQKDAHVSLFLIDYLNQARLKIQGRATLLRLSDAQDGLIAALPQDQTSPECLLCIDVIALDWNCPKYVSKLDSEDVTRQVVGGQMGQLQTENAALKARIAKLEAD